GVWRWAGWGSARGAGGGGVAAEREQREAGREALARVAIRGGRDEHPGHGAAGECFAPIPFRQQRGTGYVAVAVVVIGDVIAGELDPRGRRDRDRSSQVEGQGGRV